MTRAKATKTTHKGRVDLDSTRELLAKLDMNFAADVLSEELTRAAKEETSAHVVLDRLLNCEVSQREERRIARALRLSGLPMGMTLGNFDFGFQPGIDKKRIETLATCAFIREHTTILFQGPPGTGKTHLAVALGIKAVENGFSVAYFRLDELLHAMRKDADVPPQKLRRKKYFKAAYLVVDEVGYEPMSAEDASLFFRLVSYRYMRGSTAITTNKSVRDWPGLLAGDEAMAAAILDRLLHHSVVFNIRGRSFRLQGLESLLPREMGKEV